MSHLPSDQQVADIVVRRDHRFPTSVRLEVESSGDDSARECAVRHPDGRTWQVNVVSSLGSARADSCGKEPTVPRWWAAVPA